MRISRIAAAVLLLGAVACGGQDAAPAREESVEYAAVEASAPTSAADQSPGLSSGAQRRVEAGQAAPGGTEPPATAPAGATVLPTMLIRTGEAQVEVEEMDPAIAQVRRLAARAGGFVANTTIRTGEQRVREATLEVKVPAARFDQLLGGLEPLGEVESVSVSAQDVGEEYVDVSARVANARRLEARLVELLASRTGKLEEVLAVERELARVREEIERYEGRLRYLRTRAAVSTLTVNLHEPYPVVGDYPGANPIAGAFHQAWRNFVGFLAFFIAALGILVPLAVIGAVAWVVVRKLRGPRRPPRVPPPAQAPPPVERVG